VFCEATLLRDDRTDLAAAHAEICQRAVVEPLEFATLLSDAVCRRDGVEEPPRESRSARSDGAGPS
jgi:hypothetical protein